MSVRRRILMDLRHYARIENAPLNLPFALKMFFLTGGFQFVLCRRIQEALLAVPVVGRPIRRIFWWMTNMTFGAEIALGAKISGGLYMPHPYGLVIGVCEIGENVTVLHNVTVGAKSRDERGLPIIEDNVFLSAGCAIIGGPRIGQGATIGANAVVLKDIPAGAVAAGVPAKIIGQNEVTRS